MQKLTLCLMISTLIFVFGCSAQQATTQMTADQIFEKKKECGQYLEKIVND
jgi:uncharacterized protein YcfL